MPPRKPSPVGAHVFVTGGLASGGLAYAAEVGAEAVQVFVSNPRGWRTLPGDSEQDEAFRARCARARMPAFVHAPYLVNFGSPSEVTQTRSVEAVRYALRRAAAIGAAGVVIHAGSAVAACHRDAALRQVREHLLRLLDETTDEAPRLLVEPTAGAGESLCSTTHDVEPYFAALDFHERLGLCLDTCHAFAAGHDLAAPGGVRTLLNALVRAVGRHRLGLVHANDSKDRLGSNRDRHENIGRGRIGAEPFAELFRHPATRGVPVVVETPGKALEHRRDIATLKELRDR